MVWRVSPPNQQRVQGEGSECDSHVLLPRATTTPPPRELRGGRGAKREPRPGTGSGRNGRGEFKSP